MNKPKNKGIKRLLKACQYSVQGFKDTFKTEAAFRQELVVSVILIPLSFVVASSVIEWILLITSLLLVMVVEIINSSIEAVVDRFGEEQHVLSGKAKDAASAAVAMTIIIMLITWLALILT